MKRMKCSDLMIVLSDIPGDKDIDISDLMSLFGAFGDEYSFQGSLKVRTEENKAMKILREMKGEYS